MRMRIALPLAAVMLAGCGASDHSRFYVLTENPAAASRATATSTSNDDRPRSRSAACSARSAPDGSSSQLGRDFLFRD
jgi:hypothetical protein